MPTREELIEQLGYDPYGTSDGLWEGGKVHVKDAYFGYKPEYNDGMSLLLFWECDVEDDDIPEVTLQFSCGGDWRTDDDGKTAVKDKMKPFGRQSHVGMVLEAAAKLEVIDQLIEHGLPTEAKMWKGANWELAQIEVDYKGEIGVKSKLVPTAFFGYSGNGTAAAAKKAAAPVKAAAKKAVAKKVAAETGTSQNVLREAFKAQIGDDEVYNAFVELAQNAGGDHGTFVTNVFAEYDPEGIEEMVLDESAEGFFNTHKEPF